MRLANTGVTVERIETGPPQVLSDPLQMAVIVDQTDQMQLVTGEEPALYALAGDRPSFLLYLVV